MNVLQPITRGVSTADLRPADGSRTFLGTDCGAETAGMWHSLSGLMSDKQDCLDLARCFPLVRAERQPSCSGAMIRAQGAGSLRMQLKSADGRTLWWATEEVPLGSEWHELRFSWDPDGLREVKSLHWTAEPGALMDLDSLCLDIQMPEVSLEEELFLVSYGKLARLYSPERGTVSERAPRRAGDQASVAASGLFCLATSVACRLGLVKHAQAEQILHKVHATVADLPTMDGLLPAAVRLQSEKPAPCGDTLFSTVGTSIYYHGMLLAAQLLWDGRTLAGLVSAVREIDIPRDAEGRVITGLKAEDRKPSKDSLRDWSGETVLALLLEHMATGSIRTPSLNGTGTVPGGTGVSAEWPGLFYADFSTADADAVTRVDWLAARRAHLREQVAHFAHKHPRSVAARLGLYGLSMGEDPHGEGVIAGGTRSRASEELIRPYYVLMSSLVGQDPEAALEVMRTLKAQGLVHPWGIVSAFTRDLDHVPLAGAFSAALECLAAYHLLTGVRREPDLIYTAVEDCGLLREAIRSFYPANKTW